MARTLLAIVLCCILAGCGGGGETPNSSSGGTSAPTSSTSQTSGPAFEPLQSALTVSFDEAAAVADNGAAIDASHVSQGYVGVHGTATSRLKFQVICGEMSYNYDVPEDDSPIFVPINMGNGDYTFRVMQNTSGNNYVEILSTTASVTLEDEFQPFLHPGVYCDFNDDSECVKLARELVADAQNSGDALAAICTYVIDNVTYDTEKAEELSTVTGYVPDPDETLASGSGICFDYASLTCAMLRSQGIPCRIMTGYVSPDDIYHAWIMVYIDGTWVLGKFTVESNTWSRIDVTFAASLGDNGYIGNGETYTDRYTY